MQDTEHHTLLKNQRILAIMADAGVTPEYDFDDSLPEKKYECTACGTRRSRLCDVIHHYYTVHFLRDDT